MIPITDSIFWGFDRSGTDLVVVGTQQGVSGLTLILRDYRVSNGELKWETLEPNTFGKSVQLGNGFVYLSSDGRMAAYSLINGALVWKTGGLSTDAPIFTVSDTALFLSFRTDNVQGNYALERRDPFIGALVCQGLDRHIQEINRGYADPFPESVRQAISGLAWSLLQNQPDAYRALRDGNPQVAKHYIEQAYTHIKNLVADYKAYKPGRQLDQLITDLGPRADHQRTLKRMRAQAEPKLGEVYPDKQKIFDETIEAIFGRK